MSTAQELYPDCQQDDWFDAPGNYQPIIDSFGSVALQHDEDGYQGDTWVLYKDGARYGYLCFGWGSCSGCDALQGADSYAEIDSIIDGLRSNIRWFASGAEALEFFWSHDWDGDYCGSGEDIKAFVAKCKELLTEEATCPT